MRTTRMSASTAKMMASGEGEAMQHSTKAMNARGGPGIPGTTEPTNPQTLSTAAIM